MSIVDEVIKFITDELNIKITKKNKKLIMDKFYPDIQDKIYWYFEYKSYHRDVFYNGIITKKDFEYLKTLPQNVGFTLDGYDKYVSDDCGLTDIQFKDDVDEIKKCYDRGNMNKKYFDLMETIDDFGTFEDYWKVYGDKKNDLNI